MYIYIYIYISLYHIILYKAIYYIINMGSEREPQTTTGAADAGMGIHYRGVQWEGGAVDGGSII